MSDKANALLTSGAIVLGGIIATITATAAVGGFSPTETPGQRWSYEGGYGHWEFESPLCNAARKWNTEERTYFAGTYVGTYVNPQKEEVKRAILNNPKLNCGPQQN
jgi:hypothetical protein